MKKNRLSRMLFLLISVLAFTSCGNSNEKNTTSNEKTTEVSDKTTGNDEKVVLDFWTFWGSETRKPIIDKIIEDYNNSQDKVEVKHTFLPWGDIWTKNTAAIAAGNAPDVIVNDINSVAIRADKGQVEDITDMVAKDKLEDELFEELFNTVKYDDKVWALPFVTDTRVLFYNKDLFKEAGLDPEKPPTTWAEIEEYSKKLEKKDGDRYTQMGFYPTWGSFGLDNRMLNADNGVGYFDKDFNPVVNTDNKVIAAKRVRDYRERIGADAVNSFESEFGSQQANPFISGKVAMMIDVATFYTQIRDYGKDMNFGIAQIPEREEGSGHYSVGGGFVVEIPKGSKHKEEAYDFIKYLVSEPAQEYWAIKNFDNVANIKASEAASKSADLDKTGKYVYQFSVDNLAVTKLTPRPTWGADVGEIIGPNLDNILLNGADAKSELDDAEQKLLNLRGK